MVISYVASFFLFTDVKQVVFQTRSFSNLPAASVARARYFPAKALCILYLPCELIDRCCMAWFERDGFYRYSTYRVSKNHFGMIGLLPLIEPYQLDEARNSTLREPNMWIYPMHDFDALAKPSETVDVAFVFF
ncbi:MAG TPA: hypothetical protein VHE13_10560 [Opitutus sp.]|nr:hypothetical protein [Opitutus sp.]